MSNTIHSNPYLVIVAGPTGSGKSNLINKVKDYLQINNNPNTWQKLLLDDYIETKKSYKDKIKKIVRDYCNSQDKDLPKIACPKLEEKLLNPDKKILDEFWEAYKTERFYKTGACKPILCYIELNKDLSNAIEENKNIIFETMGSYFPSWLFLTNSWEGVKPASNSGSIWLEKHEYKIILAFTITEFMDLIKRNKTRAKTNMNKFLENPEYNTGPRLPNTQFNSKNTNDSQYYNLVKQIQEVIIESIFNKDKSCSNGCNSDSKNTEITPKDRDNCIKFCKNNVRILVFNNPSNDQSKDKLLEANQPIYDSNKNTITKEIKEIKEKIIKIINLPKSSSPFHSSSRRTTPSYMLPIDIAIEKAQKSADRSETAVKEAQRRLTEHKLRKISKGGKKTKKQKKQKKQNLSALDHIKNKKYRKETQLQCSKMLIISLIFSI